MKKKKKTGKYDLSKAASKIRVNKKLDNMEDTPFFKKKMQKGEQILSIAGLPK